ncbi:MAG: type II toxin-antitoxin system YafQ family toxin [Bacteroidota bacterium]|nr:type II toxin-antitoxin system YafQ family toxin [Bacteroidota bacterium]
MYAVVASRQFAKDYKKCVKRNLDLTLIDGIILIIAEKGSIPSKNKPHKLSGNYKESLECHIAPDWLLIWKIDEKNNILNLVRTGTHSDLF